LGPGVLCTSATNVGICASNQACASAAAEFNSGHGRDIRLEILALLDAEREEHAHHLEVWALRRLLVQHATAGRVSYRLTPWVPNNQNAEVSHNTIRMANSTPPAMGSAQPG
jgi:hypothetical protein